MKRIMASITYEKTYYGVKSNEKDVCNPVFITDSLDEIRKYVKDNSKRLEFRYDDRSWVRVLAPMVARSLHKTPYHTTVKDWRVIGRANRLGYTTRFDLLEFLPKPKVKVSDLRRQKRRERETAEREKLLTAHRLRARIESLIREIDGLTDVEVKALNKSVFEEMSKMRKGRSDDEVRFLITTHFARLAKP
jgi:hypothetical protein